MTIIVLLTDFGLQDIYVGVMKGIIKTINPYAELIDLTHEIPRQNILAGRFALMNTIDYFPPNTIYLVIVDPGVGSDRKAICMRGEKGYFIAPNNGILSGVINKNKVQKIVSLTNKKYWLNPHPSSTFHGRDIFAPVAGYLSKGIDINLLGEEINQGELVTLNCEEIKVNDRLIKGKIQYIDIYGNLITNIPANILENKSWYVQEGENKIQPYYTYSSVKDGELLALIGSHGWLEIAVNGDSAKIKLNKNYLDSITVIID